MSNEPENGTTVRNDYALEETKLPAKALSDAKLRTVEI